MKKYIIYPLLLLCVVLTSCDEGRIYEKAPVLDNYGRAAKVTLTLDGTQDWATGYSLVFAAFKENSNFAEYAKDVSVSQHNADEYLITGIPTDVKTLEVCVINTIRKRMVSFVSMDISQVEDTIHFNAGTVNPKMFNALQSKLFTLRCAGCHGGGSGTPAGNLHLGQGQSYADLVGVASTHYPERQRVVSGNADESLIYELLSTDLSSEGWGYDHSPMLKSDEDLTMLRVLRDWINNGAKE